ncbi:MAG: endonuclease [Bacteroidetes bacterium]|nr:endonuclease [Bacteroidota bacterium]
MKKPLYTFANFRIFFETCLTVVVLSSVFTTAFTQIPPGYYNQAAGKNGQTLQIALYNIIKGHNVVNYTPGVWNAFYTTDKKSNGKIWDMYSDVPGGTPPYEYTPGSSQCGSGGGGVEGDCYSREHSFPKSWFGDVSPMNTDLFHIFPTDQYVNNMHSNFPFAVVGTATATSLNGCKKGSCATPGYTGIVFEPIDAYKGDFARAYFYMATRYQNIIAAWSSNDPDADAVLDGTSYPAFETWYLNLLISWHNQDPVSAKEIARNDSIYKLQLNRNPYIDHPEYVATVWTPSGPKPEPTNQVTGFVASAGNPSYSAIKLFWTDAAGTVLPDGYLVRGSAAGYGNIETPTDGIAVADGGLDKNIGTGIQTCTFTGLSPATTYYFKIFPYSNLGILTDYKTDGTIPVATDTTTAGISILQAGDIAIVEVSTTDPDKVSFVALKQISAGTTINFTDNGFQDPNTVRTGEGFLIYTAPSVITVGTVVSWYKGLVGSGWSTPTGGFSLSTGGDQVFAYQGVWGSGQTLIFGVQTGNVGWLTSGIASSNSSYLPAALINNITAVNFPEKNGNYSLITNGSVNALGGLIGYPDNWTRSAIILTTPVWAFGITTGTLINQPSTVEDFTIGTDETVTIQEGIHFTITGNITIH